MEKHQKPIDDGMRRTARMLGWDIIPFRAWRGKLYGQIVYKILDRKSHEVLYGEQQNLRLADVRLLLDATLKAQSRDEHGERGTGTASTGGYA